MILITLFAINNNLYFKYKLNQTLPPKILKTINHLNQRYTCLPRKHMFYWNDELDYLKKSNIIVNKL